MFIGDGICDAEIQEHRTCDNFGAHPAGNTSDGPSPVIRFITELKKLCNRDPSGESTKLDWLTENLEDITASGDKALIFTNFRQKEFGGADWLEEKLSDFGTLNYGKATTDRKRATLLNTFVNDPDKKVFIGNPRTAGIGLNELTAGNYVVHFDHWWNPAVSNQATDRAHRPGQQKKVFVYHLWVEGTIEEMIQKKLEEKQLLYDTVIDSLSTGVNEEMLLGIYDDLLVKHGFKKKVPVPPQRQRTHTAASITEDGTRDFGSPEDFERLTADLFKAMGFNVRHTGGSHDGGVDVIAVMERDVFFEKWAIQCKLQQSTVGRPVVDQLLGVIARDSSYSKGVIVTNNRLSSGARAVIQEDGRLASIEGPSLNEMLDKHGL